MPATASPTETPATTVLVTGATGNQGRFVTRALLSGEFGDFEVHALTRDASTDRAKAIEGEGATLVEGDLYEPETLTPLVEDVDAVFAVSNFWTEGYDGQVEQMINLAEAAADAGVDHFVFSGVAGSERGPDVPHFASCDEIEERIDELGLPATFVRPAFFMQNLEAFHGDIIGGTLALPVAEDTVHQMCDLQDLGRVTAQVLADPDAHVGEAYELAGDEGTLADFAATFADVLGTEVQPYHVPVEDAREMFGEESAKMSQWFIDEGFDADIEALEETFGTLTTLEAYLRREAWSKDKTEPNLVTSWVKAVAS